MKASLATSLSLVLGLILGLVALASAQAPDNRCYLENGGSAENFFVSEDLPVGAFIGTLRIHGDPREHVGNIVLSLKESDSPVSIAPGTKNITLSRKLDKEGVDGPNSVYINVICDLSRTADPGFVIPVVIRVTDANDNAPLFVNAPYVLNISEVTVVGTRVLQGVKAVDADQQGPYSTVQYSVLAGPHADYFVFVNGLEGTLLLRKPLDYETLTNFTIRIRAQDQGSPAKFSDTYLFVNVIDADDQNPRFFDDRYSAVLPDSPLEGAHLRVQPRDIQAYDQDTGINAAIFYSFNSKGTDYRFFDIDRATGQVVVKKPIHDSDLMQPATLVIRATQFDNPDRYALATLTVARPGTSLKDLQFLQETYAVGVLENVPLRSVLVTVVTNHPRDKRQSFWLDDRTGTFGVNTGGDILLTKSLDFETQDRYTFKVHVTDGIMNDSARINVSVLNVNDWDPRFRHPQYDFYVGETGIEPGAVVGRVEAADGDRGDFVVLELRGPGAGMFDVNSDGEIILLDMDMLNSSTAHLVIVATDNGIPPRQASAPVVVHFPDAVVRKAGSSWSPGGTSFLLMLVFGSLLGILALVIALLILYIYKHKRNKTASETGSEAGYGVEEEKQPEVLSGARHGKVDNPVFAAGASLQERLQLAHTATVKSLAARNATMRTGNHVSSAGLAALPSPKSRLAPAPPLPPHLHTPSGSPTSSESPPMRRDNNNGELKVAWPGGSIPRRVKKLSWDDDQQSKTSHITAMEASTSGALIATAINVYGTRLFNELPPHTILGTLLFTLGLAALADMGAKKFLSENLPYFVQVAITTLFSLFLYETVQATFWIPLDNACFELAAAVGSWMSRRCYAGIGSAFCTLEHVSMFLTSDLLPVIIGAMFLWGSLYGTQSPYVPFLWRPKKPWRRLRPPTPYPSCTTYFSQISDDDQSDDSQDEDMDELEQSCPSVSGPEGLDMQTMANHSESEDLSELEQSCPSVSGPEGLDVQTVANHSQNEDMDELEKMFPRGTLSESLKASLRAAVKAAVECLEVDEDADTE